MKKFIYSLLVISSLSLVLFSCDKNHDDEVNYDIKLCSFEGVASSMLASDIYGANLYGQGYYWLDDATGLGGGIVGDQFWNAGSAITNFSSVVLDPADYFNWYLSQMSVYYKNSNGYPGYDNSQNCLIATGVYYNPTINFTDSPDTERIIDHLYMCPTSYTYYQMTTDVGEGVPITTKKQGYFQVIFVGLDKSGNKVGEVVAPLADYRLSSYYQVGIVDRWVRVDLSSLGTIHTLKIEFEGSDVGEYGLNTPAYVALDNITVLVPKGESVTPKKENIYVEQIESLN